METGVTRRELDQFQAQAAAFSPPVSPCLDTNFQGRPDLEVEKSPEVLNQLPPGQKKALLSWKRKALQERLGELKAYQPKQLIFDEMDIEPEPEVVAFERFIFEELPDEDKLAPLTDPNVTEEFIFAEEMFQTPNAEELSNANIILEAEMNNSDIFKEDRVDAPCMIFKDVQVVKEREVTPADGGPPLTGVVKVGKRTLELPGHKPMSQTYIEEVGDAQVIDENLQPNENLEGAATPVDLIAEEVLERIKDRSFLQSPKQPTPRVLGKHATKFDLDVEAIEKGEEPSGGSPYQPREEEELSAVEDYRTPSPVRRHREIDQAKQIQIEQFQQTVARRKRIQDAINLMQAGKFPYQRPQVMICLE